MVNCKSTRNVQVVDDEVTKYWNSNDAEESIKPLEWWKMEIWIILNKEKKEKNEIRITAKNVALIDDCNKYMGSIGIADQLRSYYSTQLIVYHTSIINSYLIGKKLDIIKDHKSFRLNLIHARCIKEKDYKEILEQLIYEYKEKLIDENKNEDLKILGDFNIAFIQIL
ncbi:hypothetical protein RhiirB3_436395 [Rhizophagus irregularis]|nr:hypothetical protein RhiirB3_436395 [Rhizophagus irregularis]